MCWIFEDICYLWSTVFNGANITSLSWNYDNPSVSIIRVFLFFDFSSYFWFFHYFLFYLDHLLFKAIKRFGIIEDILKIVGIDNESDKAIAMWKHDTIKGWFNLFNADFQSITILYNTIVVECCSSFETSPKV